MIKVNRKNFRGELHSGRNYVGHIFKVEGGFQVFKVEHGYGKPILDSKVFKREDFRSAGQLDLGYAVVPKYELREAA